jgi:hypothetical protein
MDLAFGRNRCGKAALGRAVPGRDPTGKGTRMRQQKINTAPKTEIASTDLSGRNSTGKLTPGHCAVSRRKIAASSRPG